MRSNGTKVVSIIQSSYIPWKGYFDIIDQSDTFILLDDVQFTKRDWRSRNKIPTAQGEKWLTVPVKVKGRYFQKICDVEINDPGWSKSHWSTIENVYRKSPYFEELGEYVSSLYSGIENELYLSKINYHFITNICSFLHIDTQIKWSMDYGIEANDPTEQLAELCLAEGATTYISGPAARNYIDKSIFNKYGIDISFFDYGNYPTYNQLQNEFNHFVSIIDMFFMCGKETMKFVRKTNDK